MKVYVVFGVEHWEGSTVLAVFQSKTDADLYAQFLEDTPYHERDNRTNAADYRVEEYDVIVPTSTTPFIGGAIDYFKDMGAWIAEVWRFTWGIPLGNVVFVCWLSVMTLVVFTAKAVTNDQTP